MAFAASEDLADELESLECIFPDTYRLDRDGAGCGVSVVVGNFSLVLGFGFPAGYPGDAGAVARVRVRSAEGCTEALTARVEAIARATAEEAAGDPAVFTVVQEVLDYLDDPETLAEVKAEHHRRFDMGVIYTEGRPKPTPAPTPAAAPAAPDDDNGDSTMAASTPAATSGDGDDDGDGDGDDNRDGAATTSAPSPSAADDDGSIDACALRALTLEAAATCTAARDGSGSGGGGGGGGGGEVSEAGPLLRWKSPKSGMYWGGFTVGLVGKPSAGKSTFFNACKTAGTAAARAAPHPFTTVDPNVGRASFRAQYPEVIRCCAAAERTHEIEIALKDVAGLVPGAYQGRGRGNTFLDDLCDADVLIHVVDGSGVMDAQGNRTGAEHGSDPADDVEWVYAEIHKWISDNVWAKWPSITRGLTGPQAQHYVGGIKGATEAGWAKLAEHFQRYRSVADSLFAVARAAGLNMDFDPGHSTAPTLAEWTSHELHRLVAHFLRARFPVLVGFNKCDDPQSLANLDRVRKACPAEVIVPMSARAETAVLAMAAAAAAAADADADADADAGKRNGNGNGDLNGGDGDGTAAAAAEEVDGTGTETAVEMAVETAAAVARCTAGLGGSTGVRDALDTAVRLAQPVVLYIVVSKLKEFAGPEVRIGPGDVVPVLFRHGTTPSDVFDHLLRSGDERIYVTGEYSRTEAVVLVGADSGSRKVVLKKELPIRPEHRVIKVTYARIKEREADFFGGVGSKRKGKGKEATPANVSAKFMLRGGKQPAGKQQAGMAALKEAIPTDKHERDLQALLKRLHKSSDRQGKSKGGKGTGSDRRTTTGKAK